ncbi:MAG: hypothetical protein K8S99_15570 [Planctomycetes bacterium]|nr:hypothetical protein [Planctomycetota bacterium]
MMPSSAPASPTSGGRAAAARAAANAAGQFPDIFPAPIPDGGLSALDARLAMAIHRTVLQRWLTLEYLLDGRLNKPMDRLEPAMRGVLLTAAAQLVFMDRLPVHAVVHESVSLARRMVRPAAAGLANAVLRRISEAVDKHITDQPWSPAADRLPLDFGFVQLTKPELPAITQFTEHLAAATSHPEHLIERWVQAHGQAGALAIARHGVVNAPTVVATEPGFDTTSCPDGRSHELPGSLVWDGSHSAMIAFLAGHPARRVQDPTATLPVAATSALNALPKNALIADLCAGRGTKTRQLAVTHPNARILATDTDPDRLADLRTACRGLANVQVMPAYDIDAACRDEGIDLLLLDVPCSNTGVLGRRPEARYRFGIDTLGALTAIQRRIVERAIPLMKRGGHILYSTCSVEPEENQQQARWLCERFGAELADENLTLPGGHDRTSRDGGYYALIRG